MEIQNIHRAMTDEQLIDCASNSSEPRLPLIPELVERLSKHVENRKSVSVEQAMSVLKKAMQDDPEYAHSWHCNVAMSFYDAMPDQILHEARLKIGNDGASRFMKLCFDVETKQEPPQGGNMDSEVETNGSN